MSLTHLWADLLLALLAVIGYPGPSKADLFDPIREEIQRRLVQQSVPSIAVAVARGEHILWEEGFGWADRESRVRATPHTLYTLGSLSKPITATAVMVLVALLWIPVVQGAHSLYDYLQAVQGYLTKLKPDGVLILHLSNRNLDLLGPAQAVSLK